MGLNLDVVPYRAFGKIKLVPRRTFTNCKEDKPPKKFWQADLFITRAEDWYALEEYRRRGETVFVVERHDWLNGKDITNGL